MSAWAKVFLGWSIPHTPDVGVNTLMRTEEYPTDEFPNQVYRIGSEFGFPPNEYLLIEYRKPFWLNGGIAIFHIDESVGYNDEGYPGQVVNDQVWPENGRHYRISLLPADRLYELERDINQGNSKDLYKAGAMLLPSEGKPNDGPFPNSDSYQGGNLVPTGVGIFANSFSGDSTMNFEFAVNASSRSFVLPTLSPSWMPTSNPSSLPSSVSWPNENPEDPSATPSQSPSSPPSQIEHDDATSTWRKLLEENFDRGAGDFIFGNKAKLDNKKCLATMCAEIKKDAYIQMNVEVTALEALAIVFDFFTDGFMDKEEIIVQYTFLDRESELPLKVDGWLTVTSWIKAENTFPNKQWIEREQYAWYLGRTDQTLVGVRFMSSSTKKFLVDNISVWGT
jgi:hypothetical protein